MFWIIWNKLYLSIMYYGISMEYKFQHTSTVLNHLMYDIFSYSEMVWKAVEVVQLVKCLHYVHKNLRTAPETPMTSTGLMECSWCPSAGLKEREEPWDSLASQPSLFAQYQARERPCAKSKVNGAWETALKFDIRSPHECAYTYMSIDISVHIGRHTYTDRTIVWR